MDQNNLDKNAKDDAGTEDISTRFPTAILLKKQKRLDELTPFQLVVEQAKTHCSKSEGCKNCPLNCEPK